MEGRPLIACNAWGRDGGPLLIMARHDDPRMNHGRQCGGFVRAEVSECAVDARREDIRLHIHERVKPIGPQRRIAREQHAYTTKIEQQRQRRRRQFAVVQ
jgi:hypothetical protein